MEQQGKIESIQIIRLIAAIGVFLYHTEIVKQGYFGVELFNIISGYLFVYLGTRQDIRKGFLRKKIVRILPVYWLYTILTYVLLVVKPSFSSVGEATPLYLLKSMFFVPFVNSKGANMPLLPPGWSLNYEMWFYLLCFLAMHIAYKYREVIVAGMIVVFTIVGYFMLERTDLPFLASAKLPIHFKLPYEMSYFLTGYMLEFVLGMLSFYVIRLINKKNSEKQKNERIFLMFASFIWLILDVGVESFANVPREIRLGVPAFIFVVTFMSLMQNIKWNNKLVMLGNITFSFYMVEYFTAKVYKMLFANMAIPLQILGLLLMLAITFLVSYVSYQIIEIKISSWLKKKVVK